MSLISGIAYNLKGLRLGLKTPRLLVLGLVRFALTLVLTVAAAVVILAKHDEILNLMWNQPESLWIVWLWHLVSWLLALLLMGVSAMVGFLIAQLLFGAIIMDYMSQITERIVTGSVKAPAGVPWYTYFYNLLRQEVLRTLAPVGVTWLLLVLSWFTLLGPVMTVLSPLATVVFLTWDSTDLVPARRMRPFSERWALLRRHLGFHLGYGLWFLIPVANILFLSFAPVGATLFYLEQIDFK